MRTRVKEVNYSDCFGFGDAYLTTTQSYSYQACPVSAPGYRGGPQRQGAPQPRDRPPVRKKCAFIFSTWHSVSCRAESGMTVDVIVVRLLSRVRLFVTP